MRPTSAWSSWASRGSWPAACSPLGAYTEFYWTVNARALMNFSRYERPRPRSCEIRRYAGACEHFFAEKMPVTHAAFVDAGRVAP